MVRNILGGAAVVALLMTAACGTSNNHSSGHHGSAAKSKSSPAWTLGSNSPSASPSQAGSEPNQPSSITWQVKGVPAGWKSQHSQRGSRRWQTADGKCEVGLIQMAKITDPESHGSEWLARMMAKSTLQGAGVKGTRTLTNGRQFQGVLNGSQSSGGWYFSGVRMKAPVHGVEGYVYAYRWGTVAVVADTVCGGGAWKKDKGVINHFLQHQVRTNTTY